MVKTVVVSIVLLSTLGIVLVAVGRTSGGAGGGARDQDVAALIRRSADANKALVRGDIDGYLELIEHSKDYTLMNPFGGAPTRGFVNSPERRAAMAKFFEHGTLEQEIVATYASGDLIVLVAVERVRAKVAGVPEQDWPLRVTQVFRRAGAGWQLVHRHADPLVTGITLEQAAALARGEKR
jgi:ketosteroid isomerase-like protein